MEGGQLGSLVSRAPGLSYEKSQDMEDGAFHPQSGEQGAHGWGVSGYPTTPAMPSLFGFLFSVISGRSSRTHPSPNPSILFSKIQQMSSHCGSVVNEPD